MSITKSVRNQSYVPSFARKAVALGAFAFGGLTAQQYVRADEPKEMTQEDFEDIIRELQRIEDEKRAAEKETARKVAEAAERKILEEKEKALLEEQARLKTELEAARLEKTETQSKERIGKLLQGQNTQLPANRLKHSHFEIKAAYDFKNSGLDGKAALQFGLGKGFRAYLEADMLKRDITSGDAEGDQQDIGAYLALTSDDFTLTFNNQHGSTTLDDSFTGTENLTSTLTSTTTSSHEESDSEFLQALTLEYHANDSFNIGLRGTHIKGREKSDDDVSVLTLGTVPNPLGGVIDIDETANLKVKARTNTSYLSGQAFMEGTLAKGFVIHGRFRYASNSIETKLNGDTVIDEEERRIQGLLRARYGGEFAHLVVDFGYQKMLDGADKGRNSHFLGAADLSLRLNDKVLGQASGWYDENRQYGGSAALALGQKPFGNSALADFARDGEQLRDITFDDGLTARQRVMYKRLVPERFIKNNEGAVFRFSIDGDGAHHLYSADAAITTSALIDGTSVHAGFTGGRGYKGWHGRLNLNLGGGVNGYVFGEHEQDSITDTRSTAVGIGVVFDFGPSESDKK